MNQNFCYDISLQIATQKFNLTLASL